jgi:hypothetical protein
MKVSVDSDGRVFYEAHVNPQSNCIYSTWNGFVNVENVKKACLAGLDLLKKYKCPYLINDNSNLRGPWQQANEWIETIWIPQAITLGLRYFAHIISSDIFGQLSAKDLEKKAVGIFNMRLFENVEQAEVWIKECQKENSAHE